MAREKVCGIYRIENLINHKSYIGQSVDIYERWREHKWLLNHNQHNNIHLLNAWRKYGENNFSFTIVERCDENFLDEREIFWIKNIDSKRTGYNLNDGGKGNLGREYTEEQIKNKCYPIFQIDLDGNVIKLWNRAQDASTELNISCRVIQGAAGPNPNQKTAGGYIWVYQKDFGTFDICNYIDSKKSSIRQYSLSWNYIRSYESIASAAQDGYCASSVSAVCRGEFKHACGYIWVYDKPCFDLDSYIEWYNDHFGITYIGQYDTIGNLIKIWDCAEDTKLDGFSPALVRANVRGKYKTHYGYVFKNIPWREYKEIIKENNDYGKQ